MSDFYKWFAGNADLVGLVLLSTAIVFCVVTVLLRLVGLRSFAKMSSTDFVTTVAIGSLMASTISTPSPSIAIGLAALVGLFGLKIIVSESRRRWSWVSRVLDNSPVYLMRGPEINHAALASSHVSIDELHAKLREANVWSYNQVINVVLETTGDISVLHRSVDSDQVDETIFADVELS